MESNSYSYITTATTTQCVTGPCILQYVWADAGANTISIIDDVTGSTATVATVTGNATTGVWVRLMVAISKGLRVVTSGTSKVTLVYRRG